MIAWLLGTRIGRILGAVVGALAVLAGVWLSGRREGAQGADNRAREADQSRAKTIEEKADAARSNNGDMSPDDRLREKGRLRD